MNRRQQLQALIDTLVELAEFFAEHSDDETKKQFLQDQIVSCSQMLKSPLMQDEVTARSVAIHHTLESKLYDFVPRKRDSGASTKKAAEGEAYDRYWTLLRNAISAAVDLRSIGAP